MKALVAIKRVLDYTLRPRIKEGRIDLQQMKMSMNPFDEIALEEALRLREKNKVSEVVLVSVGGPDVVETLRQGLAMGADRAIHVSYDGSTESLLVAQILKKIVMEESFGLCFLGKQAIDDDCNQTGQMLAALLDTAQATAAFSIDEVSEETITVTCENDGGLKTVCIRYPAVITADLRLNKPRYPSLPNIMKAKNKPLTVMTLQQLGIEYQPHLETVTIQEPKARSAGIRVDSVAALVKHLRETAKVIE